MINIDTAHEAGNLNDRLISKCKEGDLAAVESCILDGADVAHREGNTCMTGLHFAADLGHTDVVRVLIKRDGGYRLGVDPRTGYGVTPLQCAAHKGHIDTVKELLNSGAMVDARAKSGVTALMRAASSGHLEVVELLLEWNADVRLKCNLARNSLQKATREGHVAVAKMLAKYFSSETIFSYMYVEATKGNFKSVKTYIDIGADIYCKENGLMVFHIVAFKGHVDIAEYLLDCYPRLLDELTEMGWTALILASMSGKVDIVRLLLDRGANINAQNSSMWTALMNAAHHENIDVVCELLERGADVNIRIPSTDPSKNKTAKNTTENRVIGILLDDGQIDPNNMDGSRALIAAARNGHFKIVTQLLDRGLLNIDFRNEDGNSALQIAARGGHYDVVRKLLSLQVVDHSQESIINRVDTIYDYVIDDDHFNVKCFGEGPMFYMMTSRDGGTKTLLQSIVEQKLVKEREQVLDIITVITMRKYGMHEDIESLVIEEIKSAVPSCEGLANAIESVSKRFSWSKWKMMGMFSISLMIMFVAWGFYFADVVTDIIFCLDMFKNYLYTNFTRSLNECIANIKFVEKFNDTIYYCKSNFSFDRCQEFMKYSSRIEECNQHRNRFAHNPWEWLYTGLASSVHCMLPIIFSIVTWIILERHHFEVKSMLRIPLPFVVWIFKTYCDWRLFNHFCQIDPTESNSLSNRRRQKRKQKKNRKAVSDKNEIELKLSKRRKREEDKKKREADKKKWNDVSERHDNFVNLANVIEAGVESSFQFFFQG